MCYKNIIIIFVILLIPLKCYGLGITNEDLQRNIENLENRIKVITLEYDSKTSSINREINNLENSEDKSQPGDKQLADVKITPTPVSTKTDDLEKKIEELEKKLNQTTTQYETQIKELKTSLEELKKQQQDMNNTIQQTLQSTPVALPAPSVTEIPVPEATSKPIQAQQNENPGNAVVGDFLISNDHPPNDNKAFMRETELDFMAVVDPYAKANFVISGDPEGGFGLEEGYVTLLTLPGGLQSKLGKFKADFGKANKVHRHDYTMATFPNVVRNFLGDEGYSAPGVNFSVILPTDQYIELTGEAFTGGDSPSFDPNNNYVYLGHGRTFIDLNESNSLELGGTYAVGRYDSANKLNTKLTGIDFTYRWDPTDEEEHSLMFQSEVLFSKQDQLASSNTLNSMGFYTFLQYKLAKRWIAGVRYDYSEFPGDSLNHENAYSAALSFWPSEFLRFRFQFTHTNTTIGEARNDYYLQTTFVIGPHGAHPF